MVPVNPHREDGVQAGSSVLLHDAGRRKLRFGGGQTLIVHQGDHRTLQQSDQTSDNPRRHACIYHQRTAIHDLLDDDVDDDILFDCG